MFRGFERPPLWAVIAMVISAAALAVLLPLSLNRTSPAASAPAVTDEAPTSAAAEPRRVLVVGDSYTAGSDMGGNGASGWPALVRADLAAKGRPVEVTLAAAGGSGYITVGPNGGSFVQLAEGAGGPADLVVVFGSRNDPGDAAAVGAAAAQTYERVKAQSPDAALLVIGPPWVDGDPPADMLANRDAIRGAATAAGATFIDPLADGWFDGRYSALIGSDGIHPTDEGHRHLADLIGPHIEGLLPAP